MMSPPDFWSRPDGADHWAAKLLSPLAELYAAIDRNKRKTTMPWVAPGPVICVGNASMGGVGKTPFSILLAQTVRSLQKKPGFLTRGYGGKAKDPTLVTDDHEAAAVGDEALLLFRHGETCVAADRPVGARVLFSAGVDAVIMDDGFQNPSLQKDLSFLLVDAETGFGNGLVFPAGPLREKPEDALARADAVVIVKSAADQPVPQALSAFADDKPLLRAWLEPVDANPQEVIAFCGIGRPEKFYTTLRQAGYKLVATRDFPDHHAWQLHDIAALRALALEHDRPLITTEKDHVRLPADFAAEVEALPVRMVVDDPALLRDLIAPVLTSGATP